MNRSIAQPGIRRGMTLVELTTAMAIGTVLLGLAVTLLARVIEANATAGEHLEGIVVLDRLGEQFRRDVQASASAHIGGPTASLQCVWLIACDGSKVQYDISASGLRRTKTVAGLPTHRDSFALPGMKALAFEHNADANGEVSLRIARVEHRTDGEDTISGEFTIDAFLAGPCAAPQSP